MYGTYRRCTDSNHMDRAQLPSYRDTIKPDNLKITHSKRICVWECVCINMVVHHPRRSILPLTHQTCRRYLHSHRLVSCRVSLGPTPKTASCQIRTNQTIFSVSIVTCHLFSELAASCSRRMDYNFVRRIAFWENGTGLKYILIVPSV